MPRRLVIAASLALPLAAWAQSENIVQVPEGDLRWDAAITEARANLPDLMDWLGRPGAAYETLSFKVAVEVEPGPDRPTVEHIWTFPVGFEEGVITGMLGNEPVWFEAPADGAIRYGLDEVSDWYVIADGRMHGGYTIRAALGDMTPEDRARIEAMLAPHGQLW